MPIKTSCSCGKKYRLKDELAGKRVRCTDCGVVFQVPKEEEEELESGFEVVEKPAPTRLKAPEEAPPPPPPRKKKRRRPVVEDRESGGGFHLSISAGVIGGLLMMIVAVIWFVVGFFAGWIFFYPPILFVLGLIRFVWSLMGGEED